MRLIKPILAIIILIITLAPAAVQAQQLDTPRNVRFVGFSGQVAWNSVYSGSAHAHTVAYQRAGGGVVEAEVRGGLLSFSIPDFDPSVWWRVRVRAYYQATPFIQSRFSRWVEWVVPTPTPTPVTPTATPTPVTPTGTPSGSYRSTYYENRTVYEEESCADRREFRRCRQTCLRADPANCWDLTCGPWLVGVAAPPSCATPVGAPPATATVAPSGSVSCENKVINGDNGFKCTFTLHNSRVAYQAVGWMDHPDTEHRFFSYHESEDGTLSRSLFPKDCGKTFSGRAIAFAVTLKYLATVDFTHKAICSLSTDTPVPPTDTPIPTDTPVPPTDTPIPTDTPSSTDRHADPHRHTRSADGHADSHRHTCSTDGHADSHRHACTTDRHADSRPTRLYRRQTRRFLPTRLFRRQTRRFPPTHPFHRRTRRFPPTPCSTDGHADSHRHACSTDGHADSHRHAYRRRLRPCLRRPRQRRRLRRRSWRRPAICGGLAN